MYTYVYMHSVYLFIYTYRYCERQSTLQHWQRAVSPTDTKWLTTKSKGLYQVHLIDIDDGKGSRPMEK